MGTDVHIVAVDAASGAIRCAVQRIRDLEARWSRFLPWSELSQLNRAAGRPVFVSPETFELVELAIDGWRATDGRFDPTILAMLLASGYDRGFEDITDATANDARRRYPSTGSAPGCGDIELDRALRTVSLPKGVALDLGGVAKGRAADLVAAELTAARATGACVNIGGDIAVAGTPPHADCWAIAVDDVLDPDADLCVLELASGGLATSTPRLRAWTQGGSGRHHLLDPASGSSPQTGIAAVTVVAATAAAAEVLTKAAFLAGHPGALEVLEHGRAHGVMLLDTGEVAMTGGLTERLSPAAPVR